MLPWDRLYRLLGSDIGQPALQPFYAFNTISSAAVSAVSVITNDNADKVLILCSAAVELTAGVAQTVTDSKITVSTPATDTGDLNFTIAGAIPPFPSTLFSRTWWSGFLLVPPKWRIKGFGTFSAGVAANTSTLLAAGVLIPRGTIFRP